MWSRWLPVLPQRKRRQLVWLALVLMRHWLPQWQAWVLACALQAYGQLVLLQVLPQRVSPLVPWLQGL